jgi:O-antigen ligase
MIAWWFLMGSKNIAMLWRVMMVPCFLFIATVQPKTGSRGGIVVIGVVLIMLLFRFSMAQRMAVAAAIAILIPLMLAVVPADVRLRYTNMFASESKITTQAEWQQMQYAEGSTEMRKQLLIDSLIITAENPLVGVGAGNFGPVHADMLRGLGGRASYSGTHNTYTQISSEMGLPGLAFFVASLFYCWRSIRKVIRLYKPLEDKRSQMVYHTAHTLWLFLVAYLTVFCFEYIGYQPFYLVVCALVTAFSQAALRDYATAHSARNQQLQQQMMGLQPA